MPDRVAVIGAGVAGLTAAHVLARRHHVTLFEADTRLGGHAHTHDVGHHAVDSGFIVHNAATYPTLLRLFAELYRLGFRKPLPIPNLAVGIYQIIQIIYCLRHLM